MANIFFSATVTPVYLKLKSPKYSLQQFNRTKASADKVFNLIAMGKIFELTGSTNIDFKFKENHAFKLCFGNKGIITGIFKRIRSHSIELSWNVEGFNRDPEQSIVIFRIDPTSQEESELEVSHQQISSEMSLLDKKNAWQQILEKFVEIANGKISKTSC